MNIKKTKTKIISTIYFVGEKFSSNFIQIVAFSEMQLYTIIVFKWFLNELYISFRLQLYIDLLINRKILQWLEVIYRRATLMAINFYV